MSIQGIVSVYLLHAVSIMLLCRSKYNRRKTIKICAAMAAAQIGVAFWADLYLKGAVWVYLVFIITFAILMVEIFWLSAEGGCQDFIFLYDLCTDLPGSGIHGGHAGKLAVR